MLGSLSLVVFLNILETEGIDIDKTVTVSKAKKFQKPAEDRHFPTYGMVLGDEIIAEKRWEEMRRYYEDYEEHGRALHFSPEYLFERNADKTVVIPVTFKNLPNAEPFTDENLSVIGWAFDEIGRKSEWNIKFTEYKGQQNFITYLKNGTDDGCYTDQDPPERIVNLGTANPELSCIDQETILHETMHALGFDHEHERPDRDDYLFVNWSNIKPGLITNFFKLPKYGVVTPLDIDCGMFINTSYYPPGKTKNEVIEEAKKDGSLDRCAHFQWKPSTVCSLPYDKYSIMHYRSHDFQTVKNLEQPEYQAMYLRNKTTPEEKLDLGFEKRKDKTMRLSDLDVEKLHCAYRLGKYANMSDKEIADLLKWKKNDP